MNTKFIAALAVFAMMFAGFGAVIVAEANDAAVDKDLTLVYNGVIPADELDIILVPAEQLKADATYKVAVVTYVTALDMDAINNLNIVDYEIYQTYIKDQRVGANAVFTPAELDLTNADLVAALDKFTEAVIGADGIIGGMQTKIVFPAVLETAKTVTLDNEVDVMIAIAAAVLATEAEYADYLSPEEVEEAIAEAIADLSEYIYTQADMDKAVADAVAVYADYKSPEDVKKAIADAVEKAKAEFEPIVKEDNTFKYIAIIFIAATIALFALLAVFVIAPKIKAKRAVEGAA